MVTTPFLPGSFLILIETGHKKSCYGKVTAFKKEVNGY